MCYIFFFQLAKKKKKQNQKTKPKNKQTQNKNKKQKTKKKQNKKTKKKKQNKNKNTHTPQCTKWDSFFFLSALFSPLFIYLLWANDMRKIRFHIAKPYPTANPLNLIFVTNTHRKSLSNKSTKLCARVSKTNRFLFGFFVLFCFSLFLFLFVCLFFLA